MAARLCRNICPITSCSCHGDAPLAGLRQIRLLRPGKSLTPQKDYDIAEKIVETAQ
jgi:hypothetical protein